MRGVKFLLVISACLLTFLVNINPAFSTLFYTVGGKSLEIKGYLEQQVGTSLDDMDMKPISAYSTLRVESLYDISENVKFFTVGQYLFDHIFNLRSNSGSFEKYITGRDWMQDDYNHYDRAGELLKECYFDVYAGKLDLRLGKQAVGWGEADGVRLMDVINPLDYRRDFILKDPGFDETRIPTWMIKGEYYPEMRPFGLADLSLEMLWIPDIKETRMGLDTYGTVKGLPLTGYWGFPQPSLPPGITNVFVDAKTRNTSLRNSEIAARLKLNYKKAFITLNYFQGWSDDFIADFKGGQLTVNGSPTGPKIPASVFAPLDLPTLNALGSVLNPNTPLGLDASFDLVYQRMRIAGFSLARELDFITWRHISPVLRVECLYSFRQSFNSDGKEWGGLDWLSDNGIIKKDQIRGMVAFDWPIFISFLNRTKSFFITGQYFHYEIIDYDQKLFIAPYYFNNDMDRSPAKIKKGTDIWSISADAGYKNDKILPGIMFAQDLTGEAWFLQLKVKVVQGDHWVGETGLHIYDGDDYNSFGMFDRKDQLYFKLRYQF